MDALWQTASTGLLGARNMMVYNLVHSETLWRAGCESIGFHFGYVYLMTNEESVKKICHAENI